MSNSTTLEERIKQLESSLYQAKEILSFEEACAFLNFSKSYLYKLTSSTLKLYLIMKTNSLKK